MSTIVQLKLGSLRGPLRLSRTPLYLRFVLKGTDWKTLDALDLPEDEVSDGEKCYAAIQIDSSNVHVDGYRNGKRFGEWHKTATYKLVQDQPPHEVMCDYEQWKLWCLKQIEASKPESTK